MKYHVTNKWMASKSTYSRVIAPVFQSAGSQTYIPKQEMKILISGEINGTK